MNTFIISVCCIHVGCMHLVCFIVENLEKCFYTTTSMISKFFQLFCGYYLIFVGFLMS